MVNENMYAFYSEASAKQNGYAVYLDARGKEVRVTDIGTKPGPNESAARKERWSDIEYRGRVESFVRNVEGPGLVFAFGAKRMEMRR